MKSLICICTLALISLLASVPAGAQEESETAGLAPATPRYAWAIDASTGAAYVTDRSFDLIGGNDAMAVGDFRLTFAPGWLHDHLELVAGYTLTGEGGSTFQTWQTSFRMQTVQLGALYRWRPTSRLSLYGRGAALLDFDHLALTTTDDPLELSQDTLTGGVLGAAGVELTALTDKHFTVGFTLEVGYAQRFGDASFDHMVAQVGNSKPSPIPATAVDLGSIDVSGIQWRLGAAVHF